nr:immunoglobulin light chain junction region [Macaca mulatta]
CSSDVGSNTKYIF